jgi:hypothetical protein
LLRFTQLLNTTQQLTHVGGWQWDVQKQQMYWTDEVYRIHGMQPGEIEAGSPEHIERSLACYTPTDRKIVEEAFRRCAERGEPYDLEFPFTNVKEKRMRIRTTAHAVQEGETIIQVIGSIMEISKPEEEVEKGKKKR